LAKTDPNKYGGGRCFDAWQDLKARRDAEDPAGPADVNLAAAEHYMYARFMTSYGVPPTAVTGEAVAYTSLKTGTALSGPLGPAIMPPAFMAGAAAYSAFRALGGNSILRLGTGPMSPPSPGQLKWGVLGAWDGALPESARTVKLNP
jgi:hypothetical protein